MRSLTNIVNYLIGLDLNLLKKPPLFFPTYMGELIKSNRVTLL